MATKMCFRVNEEKVFNEKKGVNCQARACAIYSYMLRSNSVEKYMTSMKTFEHVYSLRG